MKYAVEMGSGAVIYIPNFMKIIWGIQKLFQIEKYKKITDFMELCHFLEVVSRSAP
jgi:hypothetical protein